MHIPWDDVQLFLAIAETGSLSAAAKQLRVGQPTVSRRLAALEYRLGRALFRRQVSGVALTPAGERLVPAARKMAEWAGEIARAASSTDREPAGLVRVAAAPGVAFDFVAPFAAWVRTKHPKLRLEVLSSVQNLDLGRGEADLALRMRAPPAGGDLVAVATLRHGVAAFATREYAATLPRRYGMADVQWICWAPPYDSIPPNPQLEQLVPGFVPSFTSDNYLVQWRAAQAGLGAMVLSDVRHRFASQTGLVPLKLDLGPYATAELHLVCARSALDIPRVRTVAHLISAEFERLQRVK